MPPHPSHLGLKNSHSFASNAGSSLLLNSTTTKPTLHTTTERPHSRGKPERQFWPSPRESCGKVLNVSADSGHHRISHHLLKLADALFRINAAPSGRRTLPRSHRLDSCAEPPSSRLKWNGIEALAQPTVRPRERIEIPKVVMDQLAVKRMGVNKASNI